MTADSDTPLRLIQGGLESGSEAAASAAEPLAAAHGSLEHGLDPSLEASLETIEQADDTFAVRERDQVAVPRLVALRQRIAESPAGDGQQAPTAESAAEPADGAAPASGDGVEPVQQEFPFALVQGELITEIPDDLYIPPAALEVFLEAFEGPLDLLLYLIKRQNLDIMEIDVAELTEQYMQYVRLMDSMQFELAAEYLVMSAMLAEIKSRMLLPRAQDVAEDDDDPRAQLIRRLQEYERFKQAAADIDEMPREERDIFIADARPPADDRPRPEPELDLKELLIALGDVLHRADMFESHAVSFEPLSTRERMGNVLDLLAETGGENFVPFAAFFRPEEGRGGVVVTFLAIMELIKESMIEIVQSEPFAPIHIRNRSAEPAEISQSDGPESAIEEGFEAAIETVNEDEEDTVDGLGQVQAESAVDSEAMSGDAAELSDKS